MGVKHVGGQGTHVNQVQDPILEFCLGWADISFFDIFGWDQPGNTKGGSITVPLTSCSTDLDYSVLQIKTKIVSCHIADSKPVKEEVKSTVILVPLVFPGATLTFKSI